MNGGKGEVSDDVRLACLDQVNRSTRRGVVFTPVAAGMLVVIFGSAVPVSMMIAWAATATVVNGSAGLMRRGLSET